VQHCASCGYENPDDVTNCQQCGRSLIAAAAAPPAPDPMAGLPPPPVMPTATPTTADPLPLVPPAAPPRVFPPPYRRPPSYTAPPPLTPQSSDQRNGRNYLTGLVIGFIPVLFFWLAAGQSFSGNSGPFLQFAGIGYLLELVLMIGTLVDKNTRSFGYGLLTMVLAGPIIGFIGCVAIISWPR